MEGEGGGRKSKRKEGRDYIPTYEYIYRMHKSKTYCKNKVNQEDNSNRRDLVQKRNKEIVDNQVFDINLEVKLFFHDKLRAFDTKLIDMSSFFNPGN